MAVSSLVPAATGPTLAEINNSVATYSKGPLDRTWTNIGYVDPGPLSTSTVTFTGLGGYKYIKIMSSNVRAQYTFFTLRFNGDSSANYAKIGASLYGSNSAVSGQNDTPSGGFLAMGPTGQNQGTSSFSVELLNPTSTTSRKLATWKNSGFDGGSWVAAEGELIYNSTSAITSVTISNSGPVNFVTTGHATDGFHVYGAN